MDHLNSLNIWTNVLERMLRGDKGLTRADTAAKAHDLRYVIAENDDDVRKAE